MLKPEKRFVEPLKNSYVMKKLLVSISVFLLSGLLVMPTVEAQSRSGRGNRSEQSQRSHGGSRGGSSTTQRPTVTTRPGSSTSGQRPGQRPGQTGSGNNVRPGYNGGSNVGQRPGQNGSNQNYKPGNNNRPGQDNGYKPGNNNRPGQDNGYRPDNNNRPGNNGYRPGNNGYRPGGNGYRPGNNGYRPGGPVAGRPSVAPPPARPGRPIVRPWSRPVPPPNWRPRYQRPLLGNFLGLTFGIGLNIALDNLYTSGYTIDGYGQREVYLRNVRELGYYWDDATLFFDGGVLSRSQFYDTSSTYNTNRFYAIYNQLNATYGAPVNVTNGGTSVTWFGYGDYINLEIGMMNTPSGYRYCTVLTYGN